MNNSCISRNRQQKHAQKRERGGGEKERIDTGVVSSLDSLILEEFFQSNDSHGDRDNEVLVDLQAPQEFHPWNDWNSGTCKFFKMKITNMKKLLKTNHYMTNTPLKTHKCVSFFNSPISGGMTSCNLFHLRFLRCIQMKTRKTISN